MLPTIIFKSMSQYKLILLVLNKAKIDGVKEGRGGRSKGDKSNKGDAFLILSKESNRINSAMALKVLFFVQVELT